MIHEASSTPHPSFIVNCPLSIVQMLPVQRRVPRGAVDPMRTADRGWLWKDGMEDVGGGTWRVRYPPGRCPSTSRGVPADRERDSGPASF